MPNHIINRLTLTGSKENVEKLLESIRNTEDEREFIDFNKIIPMPEELMSVTSPVRIVSDDQYANEMIERDIRLKKNPDDIFSQTHSITKKMYDDYVNKFGCTDWYEWACSNWGTKWNAYEQSKGESTTSENGDVSEVIFFQTAWSTPYKVILKLSELFPLVDIEVKFADEDAGSNCGVYTLFGGEEVDEWLPDSQSKEAMEVYFELWGGEEDWKYDEKTGEWNYKEE